MAKKEEQKEGHSWIFYTLLVILLLIVSVIGAGIIALVLVASDIDEDTIVTGTGNAALISIKGVITADSSTSAFSEGSAGASTIVELIEKAAEDKDIAAIVFEINSPGGSPVASDEIVQSIKNAGKPTVCYIREVGASGAYWVATATDHIIANRMSVVGSIGVISSYPSFEGLVDKWNITYNRLIAGKYKDMGHPLKPLLPEERQLFMGIINDLHEIFITDVAENMELPVEKVREIATGQVFLSEQAFELGLIDEIGGKQQAVEYLEEELNRTIELNKYQKRPTLLDLLASTMQDNFFSIGKGIGTALLDTKSSNTIEILT